LRRWRGLGSLGLLDAELASDRLTASTKRLLLTTVQRKEDCASITRSKRDALLGRYVDDLTRGERPTIIRLPINCRTYPDVTHGFSHER
jgi:hypothetical protein